MTSPIAWLAASSAEALARLERCATCPSYRPAIRQCAMCKCFMPIKARIPFAHCPAEKW
jgi:hypothetical protein